MRLPIALPLLLLLPLASAGPLDGSQPIAAVAVQASATSVLVAWVPAPGNVDGYVVYGLHDGAATPLASLPPTAAQAQVPAGYAAYEVASAADPQEGVVAQTLASDPCIYIGTVPPSVEINDITKCIPSSIGP